MELKGCFKLIIAFFIIGSLLSCNNAGKNNQSLLLLLSSSGGSGNLDVVTHFAGSDGGGGYVNGAGTAAMFNNPGGITSDGTNLYVAETNNHIIRKIVISSGVVTTLAGTAGSSGTTDGAGAAARFYNPYGITSDGTNLYVADSTNCTIRQIVIATGVVTTLAGTAGYPGSADGFGTVSSFFFPNGITSAGSNLYVADTQNHTIRKIDMLTGAVTTLAGTAGSSGTTDATRSLARFYNPCGITNDGTNLYVADTYNCTIRKIVISSGVVTTLAGTAGSSGSTDGTGTGASFDNPQGISTDGTNLYVSDSGNCTIRKIVITTGVVTTIAGTAGSFGSCIDGTGTAATFYWPWGITCVGTNLYIADTNNHAIRKIVIATGVVTTLAGSAGLTGSADGTGTAARFHSPWGITTDGTNLYVVDIWNYTIRKIVISTGVVTTLAGSAGSSGSTDGAGTAARFNDPWGITTDGSNLYVVDSSNCTIRKIVISSGVVTTLAGTAGSSGSTDGAGATARFNYPCGITTDGTNLYVADYSNFTIRKIVIATGAVTTLAGTAGLWGSTDGAGTAARFYGPCGITTDGTNLYVTDNYTIIRKIVISSGVVTKIAGKAGSRGSTDGAGAAARFDGPESIIYDSVNKKLFVADTGNNCIRKLE